MPKPGDGESRDEFVKRCIPIVLDEGTAEDGEQAAAICHSMWEKAKGQKAGGPLPEGMAFGGPEGKELFIPFGIKAVGDWELEVLGVPFGGPHGGKDHDGEYFSARTDLGLENYKPQVHYYHGYGPDGAPQGDPEEIGKVKSIEKRADGVWFRVVLDKAKELAKRVMDAARKGLARASSGTAEHLARRDADGHIRKWPLVELSLFDIDRSTGRMPVNNYAVAVPVLKALVARTGMNFLESDPDEGEPEADGKGEKQRPEAVSKRQATKKPKRRGKEMSEEEKGKVAAPDVDEVVAKAVKSAFEAREAEEAAKAEADKAEKERVEAAVAEALKAQEAEFAQANRIPWREGRGNPEHLRMAELSKFDALDVADQAVLCGILNSVKGMRRLDNLGFHEGPSQGALKALAVRAGEDKGLVGTLASRALKARGFKSDEVMQQDLTSYGDEWVGIAYSQALWEKIRVGTFVAENLPSIEVPQGMESIYLPIESTDPTYYKVAETTDHDSTMLFPVASVTSSKMATGRVQLTLAKMGARVPWSGELQEDSLIPFVRQLRTQLQNAGAEQLEHAIIDGDTETSASTNINDIAGTPAATDLFMMFNGFRKSCLVTTTANSRSGGVLDEDDFLETAKLMGTGGMNAMDVTKVAFILDLNTRWKALEIATLKTRDVFSNPTIENGQLTRIWGYPVYTSANMHYRQASRKANTSGKVDQDTAGNNTTGSLLAVRWDQWLLGYRRRMTMETTRYPRSDSYEITALMRLGLIQRDTEASAITYNLTV